ncbi:ABC transporter ATP-binding protein [Microvirga lotononidis]|uniref:ABC-type multidrug transport system, ATPase and permease component n=1 Tax=Microvirga lotononidis TaxID=864069 RepID=I4YXF1_9HYPH|nr:ABC transporter ATP-binding protein [Microvirga lotononidis]EIM28643.1 ABC-type multidrug transport system, ATPase and permease component [Microvirga lotononidis]WQO25613.1 ABC transporter ATP-binding protein [Microvirga lotononidis]
MVASVPPVSRPLRERVGALRHVPSLLRLVWQASPGLTIASFGLRLSRSSLPILVLYVGKLIIDEVVAQSRLPSPGVSLGDWIGSGRLDILGGLVFLELVLAILADLLGRASTLVDSLLSERYSNFASIRLMEHATTLDLEQFESSDQQDRLERARRQVTGRTTLLTQIFGQVQDVLTVLSLAAGLLAYAPWLIVLIILALLPAFVGEVHFNAQGYRLNYFRTPERRQLDYIRYLGSSVETAKEIKLFGLNAFLVERFRGFADRMYVENRRLAVRRAAWGTLFAALASCAYYLAYALIVWRTVQGEFSIGDLTFLSGSFLRLRGLLEDLLLGFSQIAGQALYLEDLFSFFDVSPSIASPPNPRPFPQPLRSGIVFENVGFRYPESDRWTVRHLSLTLKAREVVALVGENGAGKTTIVKLLARLYDPSEGRILLDGHDLREYDLADLRRHIGVIFQDFVRFHFTAGENIGTGQIEDTDNRSRIQQAAERSLADRIIQRLPRGYDQPLGKRFNEGADLSGGEWQKIAIARAYMRDADVLILDEPTAALDARSEYEVFQRFRDLSQEKTAVLISHRFSTVRMADRILVLENGRVVEAGSHEQLVASGGRYAELFELQASGYR